MWQWLGFVTGIPWVQFLHTVPVPCILHSPTDPRGVHLQSTISPPPVLLQSPPLPVHSSWSPGGVDWRWILDLAKFKESLSGVLVESIRTQGRFHKMHPQGIEHTISCIECLCKQQQPLPLDHRVLKYWTKGFIYAIYHPICKREPLYAFYKGFQW